jgi:hypothetical protein
MSPQPLATYLGRTVIPIPAYPPAPESMEFTQVDPVAMVRSPFTGQQQIFDWGASWMEASVTMPPLQTADAINWVTFLRNLKGQANCFQFAAAFVAAYPWLLDPQVTGTGLYWCLKAPARKWSLTHQRVFGMQFEILQVL